MPKIFTTPCAKAKQRKFNFLRWIFRAESLAKPIALCEQISLARQSRLKVQNALAQHTSCETSSLKFSPNTAVPISNMLEAISQNISKMDQNLYATKANMEEILRANSNDNDYGHKIQLDFKFALNFSPIFDNISENFSSFKRL